jgi:hypothetical protein
MQMYNIMTNVSFIRTAVVHFFHSYAFYPIIYAWDYSNFFSSHNQNHLGLV